MNASLDNKLAQILEASALAGSSRRPKSHRCALLGKGDGGGNGEAGIAAGSSGRREVLTRMNPRLDRSESDNSGQGMGGDFWRRTAG